MTAEADDLRYFHAAHLGRSVALALTQTNAQTPERLEPGRYLIQILDETDRAWIKQGAFDDTVTAELAVPSFPMGGIGGIRAIEIHVRQGSTGQGARKGSDKIAGIMDTGQTATLIVTQISRPRRG